MILHLLLIQTVTVTSFQMKEIIPLAPQNAQNGTSLAESGAQTVTPYQDIVKLLDQQYGAKNWQLTINTAQTGTPVVALPSCIAKTTCHDIGTCTGKSCIAKTTCHDIGTCTGGICSTPFKTSGASCDDGTAATVNDICDGAGKCAGISEWGICQADQAVVTTVAGQAIQEINAQQCGTHVDPDSCYKDGDGKDAKFRSLGNLVLSKDGSYLIISEPWGQRIRKMSTQAPYKVTTIAGAGGKGYKDSADGLLAHFKGGSGDGLNNIVLSLNEQYIYVADMGNHRIRVIDTNNNNEVTTLAGSGTPGCEANGNGATGNTLNKPHSMALSTDGTALYVLNSGGSCKNIVKIIISTKDVTEVITGLTETWPAPMVALDANHLIVGATKISIDTGNKEVLFPATLLSSYLSESKKILTVTDVYSVYQLDLTTQPATKKYLAGSLNNVYGWEDGKGTLARFHHPFGVVVSKDGKTIWVAESIYGKIRKVTCV